MQEILDAEQQTDDPDSHPRHRPSRQRKTGKRKREVFSDPEDKPYASTVPLTTDSESDSGVMGITPDEVRSRLLVHVVSSAALLTQNLDCQYVAIEDQTP
jgi:hypothetical protein